MRVFNKSNLESILKTTNGEREDLSGEREKCTRDDPFSFLFHSYGENNNNLKKLLSLLSHHNVSEILHIITNFFQ